MNDENEKKGLLGHLTGSKKAKKCPCCCNYEIEELTEENADNKDGKAPKKGKGCSCCK